jgi:hypothetical protein
MSNGIRREREINDALESVKTLLALVSALQVKVAALEERVTGLENGNRSRSLGIRSGGRTG